jgi:hypothetical protein
MLHVAVLSPGAETGRCGMVNYRTKSPLSDSGVPPSHGVHSKYSSFMKNIDKVRRAA